MRSTRVPVTGVGVVAPGGIGVDEFRAVLRSGRTSIAEIRRFDTNGLTAHKAALIESFNPRDFISPMKMRRMNTISRFALSAARLALRDRGGETFAGDVGVALGTAFGPVQTSVDYMKEYVEKGAALAPPQLFAESVANAPGSHIAIEFGLRGFNTTVTQRESSALAALMYGAMQIAKGTTEAALIGGVDEVNEMLFSVLDRLGALAHADGEIDEGSRPFDRRRNGLVMGEGSAIIVLEAKPSRAPYAFISGVGIARDNSATTSDWGTGSDAVIAAMQGALDDAGITRDQISAVYASANSSRRADALEARAISSFFGSAVPVVATKGIFGEYAAAGGLQLVAALLSVSDQVLHTSTGHEEADADVQFKVNREYRAARIDHVLVNSASAGGGIVCAILSKEAQ